ncbi:RNA polymerase II-associated [Chlorella sorokiniana]|uniref:RNA polymerase II-associated n=1 Tax=Chlorella sorokiniana TaxID=3076 RepID=A0A2P6TZ58_CHLSO|nr:RNA polymerase II-associated [Chlorella sorokiniana]|eukprot:PRW59348.1 RNA polymerase II-associated [Chlorella sorokiniana]
MAGLMAAMQSALKDIVGDVQERAVAAPPQPPPPPVAPAAEAPGGAFPAATHRKLSKFALGRQQQRSGGVAAAAAGPPAAQPAATETAAVAAADSPQDDESRIDAENRQLLAAMSEEQLAAAREEVLQRLPPGAADFLRRRGAEKAAKAGPAAGSAATAAAAAAGSAGSEQAPAAGAQPAAKQAAAAARALPQRQQPQPSQLRPAAGGSDSAPQASLAARLRFDVEGAVVGLRPAGSSADVSPAEVAERDPLRQEGGASGEGYSVQEACLLARSSVPQQRVLALRLLRAVLALSRPSVAASDTRLVTLPAALAAQLEQEGQCEAVAVEWVAVWHHALHAADMVLLLRRSLDDPHSAVVAAAAEALTALVGASGPAGAAEEAAAEMADACTLTGWPVPAMRHMQRPTASGAWVAAPAAPQLHLDADVEDEGQEEALNEHQLAKVDPLSGLLHMSLLERIVYLLTTARAAAAVEPLLSILIRCCQAGKDVANQIMDTPGMTDALKTVLDSPPPPVPAGGAAAEGPGDATAGAFYAARPKALRLLRQLAQASKAAARQLQEEGLVRFALDQLLRPAGMAVEPAPARSSSRGSSDGGLKQRGQLTEALRLWRSYAQHGFYLLLLDDAYPSLCTHFTPPPLPPAANGAAQEQLQQWAVAREAYAAAAQLCWHAARCEQHDSQLSPQCAAALAAEALGWLAGCPLQQLLDSCAAAAAVGAPTGSGSPGNSSSGGAAAAAAAAGMTARLSSFPAVAAAMPSSSQQAVLLSTLAAVLHFVGSYWSTQTWHTAAEKAAAAQQLATLGLLPAADADSSSGSSSSMSALQQALLLAGYAAPWLAMMPEPDQAGTQGAAAALEPPANIALLRPQGSRLPLPADWMLHGLPLPPVEAHLAASPGGAGEGALLLALGWEQQQLGSMGPWAPGDAAALAEHKLRSTVLLLFGEQHEQGATQGVVPGALEAIGEEEEEEDDRALWERPLACWVAAALMDRYCAAAGAAADGCAAGITAGTSSSDEAGSGLRGWQQQEARQLAQHFAAASYGDALFGAAVALLLRRTVRLDVQLEVLSVLADEQALHLLPPLRLLPGSPAAYLASPSGSDAGAFGQACFGAAAGAAGASGSSSRRQETDLYLKLLSDGPLERCLAASSSGAAVEADSGSAQEGDGTGFAACSAAVPLVLHRLASACFDGPDASSAQPSAGQGHALLCSILQRCSGGSPEQQHLLGMLLRWDTTAGAPSDALSQGRVAAIEAACSAAGIDAAGVLGAALEA